MVRLFSLGEDGDVKKALGSLCVAAALSGCATSHVGNAPGSERGGARIGEKLPTETLIPGVASALFPDPTWR
jgi:hypothetical protein